MDLYRPTWFEIDLDAAAENLRTVRRLVGPDRKIFAVLKADAYGFGLTEMAEVFAAHGADAVAVADVGEAIRLRRRGFTLPILVYPSALPSMASEMIAHELIPTLTDLEAARAYSDATRAYSGAAARASSAAAAARGCSAAARASSTSTAGSCPVFVKVDVGLQRLGVAAEEAVKLISAMLELPHLRLEGLCAHLHAPAGVEVAYVDWQFSRFTAVLDGLSAQGIDVPIKLAASSPLVLRFPDTYLNAVDPGWMLYGVPVAVDGATTEDERRAGDPLKARLSCDRPFGP